MTFRWPAEVRFISSGLGDSRYYGPHEGIDIAPTSAEIKAGRTRVFSIAPGTVVRTGFMPKGYGHYVVVRHPDGATSLYGHLSQIAVKQGQKVESGSPLGRMGSTGMSTGTHLHLTVRDPQGRVVNPLKLDWGRGVEFASLQGAGKGRRAMIAPARREQLRRAKEPEKAPLADAQGDWPHPSLWPLFAALLAGKETGAAGSVNIFPDFSKELEEAWEKISKDLSDRLSDAAKDYAPDALMGVFGVAMIVLALKGMIGSP